MRLGASRSNFLPILLVLSAAAACDGKGPIAGPTPPTAAPAGPASPVAVRVEGRVLDGDQGSPVAGAIVRADRGLSGILQSNVTVTTDGQGLFSFTANVSSGWRELLMSVTRDGFEPSLTWVSPDDLTADVRLVPTLVIRPGQTIEVGVFVNSAPNCFVESALCRRVIVDGLLPGESVDLDVVPLVDGEKVRLAGPLGSHPYSVDQIGSRVTTTRGEVYIVPFNAVQKGVLRVWEQRVALTARRNGTAEKP
jgi:hypothetical protein